MPVHDLHDVRENPSSKWISKTLTDNWEALHDSVTPDILPLITLDRVGQRGQIQASMEQLGCGAYGCVLETNDKHVVLKITTDEGEYEYATRVQPKVKPPGVVEYIGHLQLEGQYKKRPVFALWREAAENVGKLLKHAKDRKACETMIDLSWWVGTWLWQRLSLDDEPNALYEQALRQDLPTLRRKVEVWSMPVRARGAHQYESGKKIAGYLTSIWQESQPKAIAMAMCHLQRVYILMSQTEPMELIGEAFLELGDKGFMITDAHEGNLGQVDRDGVMTWVVTDPGHLLVLPSPWPRF